MQYKGKFVKQPFNKLNKYIQQHLLHNYYLRPMINHVSQKKFKKQYKKVLNVQSNYKVHKMFRNESNKHPSNYKSFECGFVTDCLKKIKPKTILDIGSYRNYLLGLSAYYNVISVDVRPKVKVSVNENIVVKNVKNLDLFENTKLFEKSDVILSLSSIEHFGLGRYGDEIDLDADKKAFEQFKKVLKPGGYLIFTTTIKKGEPEVCFNAHRIYNINIIHNFCRSFKCIDEKFYSKSKNQFCEFEDITSKEKTWDVYMGCWVK